MNKWVDAVHFLRSEGFKDSSIVDLLDEIRGIGLHQSHQVDAALFEYIDKVIISENRDLNLPINLYVRPSKSCQRSINKIVYALLEEKKIINISNSEVEKVFTDHPARLKESLGEDFLKAFHLELTDDAKDSNIRILFETHHTFTDGYSYLLAHEYEVLNHDEISLYQKLDCDLMIVASLESSVGSRMKLAIDSKLPLLCELFEETNFLDKFYYSDQLSVELKEKCKNATFQEAG
jgi:hypothetical protein